MAYYIEAYIKVQYRFSALKNRCYNNLNLYKG